ncbi:hypothetical protein TSAR_010724 [Trichomalopsis sarcophagae]|uniref:Phorbol-ester/DAG-type domain-containing protein n=1 Tax=Trichomalopsis sarcophagae TaxID=543379 RepID=A0A232ENN5_9HYME|nr:hypothetical protein TSAR_010724 [Trichomalopsis sarcophagae]
MSDDQRTEELLGPTSCKICTKVIANRNPRKCDKCEWHYHARCTPTQPIFDNGKRKFKSAVIACWFIISSLLVL